MKKSMLLVATLSMMIFATAAVAADIDGKWKANLETPNGAMEITYAFQANGEELNGTVGSQMGEVKIQEGRIKGDEISFLMLVGEGQFKVNYKGKLAGDELKLTMSFGGGDMPPFEVTAKRVK